jgi:hypothetical protein
MINARWHARHLMPKTPTLAQRLAWHRAHAQHCACRSIPPKLAALMRHAGIAMPRPAAPGTPIAHRGRRRARPADGTRLA